MLDAVIHIPQYGLSSSKCVRAIKSKQEGSVLYVMLHKKLFWKNFLIEET